MSMKLEPGMGSPPIPTQVDWPEALVRGLLDRFVGQGAGAGDDAHLPGLWMWPGMMPILHSPGVMTPGQLGPIIARRFPAASP